MICDDSEKLDIRQLWLKDFPGLRIGGITIPITTTPCHFGGERRWFLCPACGRRCAVLYKPGYRCRICLNGRYRIEHLSPFDRKIATSHKLRRRLGQYRPNISMPIPGKPERMRWHTYLRRRARIITLEQEIAEEMNRWKL